VIRVLATSTGSLDQAEEYAAVAFERAAAYPGPIDDLAAWCVTAGRRAWIDDLRRAAVQQRLARDAAVGIPAQLANNLPGSSAVDPHLPGADGLDDRVALLFVACDDVLAPGAQMVLALRLVCGLSIDQIAGHLGIEDAAAAARLTRAKRRLAQARGRFRLADDDERAERLPMVLACVAGMHTHGHRDLRRDIDPVIDLSRQALSIADSLVVLYPQDTEVRGLRAVIRLGLARRPGRLGPDGSALPLEEVDRTRWDASLIHAGLADAALAAALPGRFALEAAISGIHCVAPDLASTDWPAIELLYAELYRHWPSPAVEVAALIAAGYRLRYAPDLAAGPADPAELRNRTDPADQTDRRRSLVRRLEQIVEQGPGYASRDAALALADIDWHAGRTDRAAARYADLADLLDGPMRAFCLRRVREARHRPG
jgi:RNA polymerase sigma-70 factor (ECF subfamily)